MPDPAAPFMQYAPPLMQMTQPSPGQNPGQTLAQGMTQGLQNFMNPYQALMKKFGIGNPNASLLPAAAPMPVGPGAPPQPPAQAQPMRPAQPGQPGPMIPPGFMPNAPGLY